MCPTPHLRIETNPVSEMLCSLEYRTMDKVQNPSKLEYIFLFYINNHENFTSYM
jgi:hypothetical protein